MLDGRHSPAVHGPVLIEGLEFDDFDPPAPVSRSRMIAEETLRADYARAQRRGRVAWWLILLACVEVAWGAYVIATHGALGVLRAVGLAPG